MSDLRTATLMDEGVLPEPETAPEETVVVEQVPRAVKVFTELGVPGMTIPASSVTGAPPRPRPLVNRCLDCGTRISDRPNYHWCYRHLVEAIEKLATGVRIDSHLVHYVAEQSTSEQRIALIRRMEARQEQEKKRVVLVGEEQSS